MNNPYLDKLLAKELNRKEFLLLGALAVGSIFGVVGTITKLLSHASTPASATEPESGQLGGNVGLVSDSTASGGGGIKFGSTAVATSASVARWYIAASAAPKLRVTYQTSATSATSVGVYWVGSFAAGQAQTAWSISIDDMTSSTTGVFTKAGTGAIESTSLSPSLTPGHAYKAWVTITQTDGQKSPTTGTRFVVPSGRVVYLEDYGAVGDGVTNDGTDFAISKYSGPFTDALIDMQYGDTLRSRRQGVTISGVSASGTTVTAPSGGFLSSHVGKPIIVYGAGSFIFGATVALHSTVTAVAGNGKSATIADAVTTAVTNTKIMVAFPNYLIGHIAMDSNHGPGGYFIDMTGCILSSQDPNYAGFTTILNDITYTNVHYKHYNTLHRGTGANAGKNNNHGTFFTQSSVGTRILNCYSEDCQDAAFLFFGSPSDCHVVDCFDDHSYADAFHATGGAHDIQFIRPTAYYPGDDGFANVGYASGGTSGEPYNITWESPTLINQDWGRGLSMVGCHDILYANITINGTASVGLYIGQEGGSGGTMDTHFVQIRGGTVKNTNYRQGQSPLTQPSYTGKVPSAAWLLFLSSEAGSQQSDWRLESINCADGYFAQIVSYGATETFKDTTIIVKDIAMTGNIATGVSYDANHNIGSVNWLDDSTWRRHIDMTAITVPAGYSPAPTPINAGTGGGA